MKQSRWDSPVLRGAIVMIILYGLKQFLNIQASEAMINHVVDFIFLIVFGLAAANDPTNPQKF